MKYLVDNRLNRLKNEINEYFTKSLNLYSKTRKLINEYDENIARDIKDTCQKLDIEAYDLEKSCIKFMAAEQPFANDLMYVESAIRIIGHIKRINHLYENITDSCYQFREYNVSNHFVELNNMSKMVNELLINGFNAFRNQDLKTAKTLDICDDEIDEMFDLILKQTTELLSYKTDFANEIINILFVARFLERIADRVVSIGERVIFINTYKKPKIEDLKNDE